ncbi:MAG TPA: 2-dehydro-3-deoxygalactonokinase [Caulobacteraceae bacterium]|nr:2-dehydro-3-deoxygalactonokinase [Caulobacteraceae bacterium]
MSSGPFLAVDWGTTNLRAWRLDAGGEVLQRAEFPLGVSQLAPGQAAARFESEVRPALGAQDLPALMCGMIGSTLGWANAPYLDCPVSLAKLAGGLLEVAPGVRIVPGLTCAGLIGPDLMRGEETQVLGWQGADPARLYGRHLLCHPGTHAKWVRIEKGEVTRFVTAMTGELYDVLGAHGVLKFNDPPRDDDFDVEAFDRGAAAAGDGGALASRLFGLRGLTVSGQLPAAAAPSWLSGLLIGAEIASLWPLVALADEKVAHVVGAARLCDRYARVLTARGVGCEIADGETAVIAGLTRVWAAAP